MLQFFVPGAAPTLVFDDGSTTVVRASTWKDLGRRREH
jgi:hypothetical protein